MCKFDMRQVAGAASGEYIMMIIWRHQKNILSMCMNLRVQTFKDGTFKEGMSDRILNWAR